MKEYCDNLKKARDEYRKEMDEHGLVLKFQSNPKEGQKYINSMDGLEVTYALMCEEEVPCKKLKMAWDNWKEEIERFTPLIKATEPFRDALKILPLIPKSQTMAFYEDVLDGLEKAYNDNCKV